MSEASAAPGFSPIIKPPKVAITGAGRAELRQVFTGEFDDHRRNVTLVLPVRIAFDHGVTGGAEAARLMNTAKAILCEPAELALRG